MRFASRSEQPCEELTREQREPTAECDAGDLTFRSTFAKHEHQSAYDDRDECERSCERASKRRFEVQRGAFAPNRLPIRNDDAVSTCAEYALLGDPRRVSLC